jgi:8-oxo-dGTP pyrophosphatase MutT (NUDIX family)
MSDTPVVTIDELNLPYVPRSWAFADERRAEIEAYFQARRQTTPGIWNGRVLVLSDYALRGRRLQGTCFDVDFASFLAWREWGYLDKTVTNCFAMGALQAADGAFLLGVMGMHTANAGHIYFPAGTPELTDVRDGVLDLTFNVIREVIEETGLSSADFVAERDWRAVVMGPRLALFKRIRVAASASDLRARILDALGREQQPEFSDIRIVRGPDDFDPMIPPFVITFLRDAWRSPTRAGELSDGT